MTRLVHSAQGYLRKMQISSTQFYAFVEGRLDRTFFDKALSQAFSEKSINYQVVSMKEIPPGTGGKQALLGFFKLLRNRKMLSTTAFGKKMVCSFMADKDADDFCKKLLRSKHLFYSKSYDLESHLVACGDFHRSLAEACGITRDQARQLIKDQKLWLKRSVGHWSDWIALCLISQAKSVNVGATFDRVSQVNPDPLSPPDLQAIDSYKKRIREALAMGEEDFENIFAVSKSAVEAALKKNEPLRYFKGKWFSHLFQRMAETLNFPADANLNGIWDRMQTSLLSQVASGVRCAFCAHYQQKLDNLITEVL